MESLSFFLSLGRNFSFFTKSLSYEDTVIECAAKKNVGKIVIDVYQASNSIKILYIFLDL